MQTRAKLLAAARHLFASRGHPETSIADITETADVGVGTFYLHFRDKEEVYRTLVDEGLQEIRQQIWTTISVEREPGLAAVIRAIFQHSYAQRDIFQIALSTEGLHGHRRLLVEQIAQVFQRFLQAAQAQGILDVGYDVPLLARFIAGMIIQGMPIWFDHDEASPEIVSEQLLRLLARGLPTPLLAGLEQDASSA